MSNSAASTKSGEGVRQMLDSLFQASVWRRSLENGLTVIHRKDSAHALVSIQYWIKTGSIHEGTWTGSGLSHFLEHMLFKGTLKRSGKEIAETVQGLGGSMNAFTSFDRTVYLMEGPSESAEQFLDILSDMVFASTIPEEEVLKEREVILREIDMGLDDPDRVLARKAFGTAFNRHPYQFPVIGKRGLFEQINGDALRAYYEARYQPSNAVLVIAGNVESDIVEHWSNELSATYPSKPVLPLVLPPEPEQLARREERLYGAYNICRGIMAFKIPSLRHPDAPALDVLSAVLGAGQSGWLRHRLRNERKILHHIEVSSWNPGDSGLFWIQYVCDPERQMVVEEAIREEIAHFVQMGCEPAWIEKARRFAIVSEINSRQTVGALASRVGMAEAIIGDINYPKYYFERLMQLGPADLTRVASQYLIESNLTVVSLGPDSLRKAIESKNPESTALPSFQIETLSNGARLLWQQDSRLPKVHLRYSGLGGAVYESRGHRGITGILANLLTRDTRFKKAVEVAESLESGGGHFGYASGNNSFSLSIDILPDDFSKGIQLLEEALLYPEFNDKTIERELDVQVSELKEDMDEIGEIGRKSMRKHFFGDHPFSVEACGEISTLKTITPDILRVQYQRLITSENAVLTIVGDFDPETILPLARTTLQQLPDHRLRRRQAAFEAPTSSNRIIEFAEKEQTVLFLTFPDPGFCSEENLQAEIMDAYLSDMAGPLFTAIREDNNLAYYTGASRILALEYGAFFLYAGTRGDQADKVFELMHSVLKDIREGELEEAVLQRVKRRHLVEKRTRMQNPASRAANASLNSLYGRPLEAWRTIEEDLEAISPKSMQVFAQRWLTSEKGLEYQIGPKSETN